MTAAFSPLPATTRPDAAGFAATLNGTDAPLTQSLPEQIAARLSERIVSGSYLPGQRIMEQAIASEFQVSRGPVREALRLLEKEGLMRILPRRGAQVTNPTIEEVTEIFDIRANLNGLRDRLIAESPARLAIADRMEAEMAGLDEAAEEAGEGDRYIEIVTRLNRLLTSAVDNQRLKHILGSLALQTIRYTRLGLSTPGRRSQSVRHWHGLLQAIRDGDGDTAERIARQRVIDSRNAAMAQLRATLTISS
jgi:DNA-binding GntR family transcriptional regulator